MSKHEEENAWEKIHFTAKQKKQFKADRQNLAAGVQRLQAYQPAATSTGIDSYAISGTPVGGDPSDPNSYLPPLPTYPSGLPDWYTNPVAVSPEALKPLPTGKAMDRLAPGSPELVSRQQAVKAYAESPEEFAEKNAVALNQEETILDKGLGFLGGLFNYQDESDLSVFGVNLSGVESTWDLFMQTMTGGRNLLDVGIGGLISAMPGGVQTMTFNELTGGQGDEGGLSVTEVLQGKMGLLDNPAPSPMQIAIASVAIETKRIREGGAQLSDVLLLNPATAPFILAGLAAESSPLQQDDFNLLDPEDRKKGFASGGWEQFFSGVGDFGVQMASPWIGIAAGAKVAQLGALGVARGPKFAKELSAAVRPAYNEVAAANVVPGETALTFDQQVLGNADALANRAKRGAALRAGVSPEFNYGVPIRPDAAEDFWTDMFQAGRLGSRTIDEAKLEYTEGKRLRDLTPDGKVSTLPDEQQAVINASQRIEIRFNRWFNDKVEKAAKDAGDPVPKHVSDAKYTNRVRKSTKELGLKGTLSRFINDIAQVDEFDNKVMDVEKLYRRIEFRRGRDGRRLAAVLHSLKDPYHIALTLETVANVPGSRKLLYDALPSVYDQIYRFHTDDIMTTMRQDPTRWRAGMNTLVEARRSLTRQMEQLTDKKRTPKVIGENPDKTPIYSHNVHVDEADIVQRTRIIQSIDEIDALIGFMNGRRIDLMAPGPFYSPGYAAKVIDDLYEQGDAVTSALQGELKHALAGGDRAAQLILKDNWYARQVGRHRERAANAAYVYAKEGTGLIPRRVLRELDQVDEAGAMLPKARARYEWEWGWVSGSVHGTGRLQRAARVWRWMGTETPAGYVGLKGLAILGSEREIRAALSLDAYEGQPVMVSWIDKSGTVRREPVGGQARREELMGWWDEALKDSSIDKKTVLTRIEDEIAHDFARMYGLSTDDMTTFMQKANKYRAQGLETVRKHGMAIDEDGGVHHIPWLKEQLANGTYMHNWEAIERLLQRRALDEYGPQAGGISRTFAKGGDTTADMLRNADNLFQSFWRPAVLLRLGYTQRNVFEGLVRSSAYFASLAPLAWPVQATYFGLSNAARRGIVKRATKGILDNPVTAALYKERNDLMPVFARHHELETATGSWSPDPMDIDSMISGGELSKEMWDAAQTAYKNGPYRFIWGRSNDPDNASTVVKKILGEDEYQIRLAESYDAVIRARKALEPLEDQFDKVAGKGRFATWREAAIKDMDKQVCEARMRFTGLQTAVVGGAGGMSAVDNMMSMIDAGQSMNVAQRHLDTLRYDPMGAIQMYRGKAGRQRSIGSGQSRTTDGHKVGDAWDNEFELYNKGVASSETARRTTFTSASNASENLFRSATIRENIPIPYSPLDPDAWHQALAETMEKSASNPIVRILVENDMNSDAALEWMLRTDEGREFLLQQRFLEGTDFDAGGLTTYARTRRGPGMTTYQAGIFKDTVRVLIDGDEGARFQTIDTRLQKMAEKLRDPVTGHMEMIDHIDAAVKYVSTVSYEMRKTLQESPDLIQMLATRARSIKDGSPIPITSGDVENVVRNMTPEQRANLSPVSGSDVVEHGTKRFLEIWRSLVTKTFHVIGTMPEDSAVRFPFYNKRFKQVRNELVEMWYAENGGIPAGAKRGLFSKTGNLDPDGFTHPKIRIPKQDLEDIMYAAHKQALFDVREYLYTIERRTNLGKYGEYVLPFISATQNTMQAGGKILYRNPWVAPLIAAAWTSPEKLGWYDDDGNLRMPMPFEAVNEWLKDREDIPIIGGILSGTDYITIAQNGLNVFTPDTGFFDVIPRPGANVQWVTSQLMQLGMIPVEPPAAVTAVLGDEQGASMWEYIKDYVFGDEGSMSTRPLSYDTVVPPWFRRFLDSRDENSEQYGKMYQMEYASQQIRIKAGERPPSDDLHAEVHKRVTNMFWFNILGAIGVPTPMTPYPILTRPSVQKQRVNILQDTLKRYMDAQNQTKADGTPVIEPGMATMMFSRDFGDDLLPEAISATRMNTSGAEATVATVADIKAFDHLIREVAPKLGTDMELLDILVNNSNPAKIEFSSDAFRWQQITKVPGTSEEWSDNLSPEEATAKRNRDAGWVGWQKFQDDLEAKMFSRGVKGTENAGGRPYALAKEAYIIEQQRSNPDWYIDYTDAGGNRTNKTIMVLETAIADETFQTRMFENGKEGLLGSMQEYLFYRRHMVTALEQSGKSINDPANAALKESWGIIRQELSQKDERWAEIANRWLSTDDNPQYPGNWTPSLSVMEGATP